MTKPSAPQKRDFSPLLAILIAVGLGFFASAFYFLPPMAEIIQGLSGL